MKKVLLIVATEEEWDALKEAVSTYPLCCENDFIRADFGDFELVACQGGIGKGSMAFAIGKHMGREEFNLVVNTGVAGTLEHRLSPLSALCATRSAYYDVWLPGWDYKRGQMAEMPLYYECDRTFVECAKKIAPEVETGLIVTGDNFVTKDNMPTGLDKDFENPVAIDMESAAVGQCCHIAKVPYGILRTISDDTAGDDNAMQYEDNLGEACRKAVLLAIEIIKLHVSK